MSLLSISKCLVCAAVSALPDDAVIISWQQLCRSLLFHYVYITISQPRCPSEFTSARALYITHFRFSKFGYFLCSLLV